MKTFSSPKWGVASLLPALAILVCLHVPKMVSAQSSSQLACNQSNLKTVVRATQVGNDDFYTISTFFKGNISENQAVEGCAFSYQLLLSLPAAAEISLLSSKGWLSHDATNLFISTDPTRDAIHVTFDVLQAKPEDGPALVLQLRFPHNPTGFEDIFGDLEGIVQVDIIAPAKMRDLGLDLNASVYPNPANSEIHWANPFGETARYNLYSMEGKMVYSGTVQPQEVLGLNTQDSPSGIYLFEYFLPQQAPVRQKVRLTH